ncbi:MAG: helix-turn-helix domain-containing protein [Kangiellaceae bacterium]|nr:helix-turn-helix domain-containing protein [Kangiellaceae bacterium]
MHTSSGVVRLRSKLWLVLNTLVNNPNRLVLREDLVKDIWRGNNYTGEQGLTHAVCHLRRILKKYEISASIITLPKKGYILQFNGENSVNANSENRMDGFYQMNNFSQEQLQPYSNDFEISYIIS